MPDVKISALPTASIVGLSDIFVLNQGGITKTAAKSLITAGLATTDQIGGLNSAQVQALTSAQIAAITPATIGAVATSDIIGISKGGTGATDAVSALSALGGITSAAISGFASTSQLSGFATTTQIVGIAFTSQLSAFATTSQISGFTNTAQVSAIASAQIAAITPASIGALSTDAASGFATTGQISGFTTSAQVQSLASAQIAAITPASIGAVSTSAVIAISKGGTGATDAPSALSNLGGITSAALTGYATTAQVGGLSSAQVNTLAADQILALGLGQDWKTTTEYKGGDVVSISSQVYVAKPVAGNINQNPMFSPSYWFLADTNAATIVGQPVDWTAPSTGNILVYNGSVWISSEQASGLSSSQVEAITSSQITAITPASIGAFATSAIIAIGSGGTGSTDAVSALTALGAMSATQAAGGDLSGNLPNPTVAKIQGNAVSEAAPSNGQVLQWNGTAWVPGEIPSGGSGGGGQVFFFNYNTAADAPTTGLPTTPTIVKELGRVSDTTGTSYTSGNLSTTGYDLVVHFVTDVLDPNITSIPAGLFDFNFWASSTGTTSNQTIVQLKVFKYDGTTATLLATSDDISIYDPTVTAQYIASVVIPQTTVSASDRLYIQFLGKGTQNNRTITLNFGATRPAHVHTTVPSVGGSGLVKVVDGVFQSPASLLVNADVATNAAIALSKVAMSQVSVLSGDGLTGGGDLSTSRTLALTTTGVSALSYGSSTQVAALTVDAYGRLTAASNQAISATGIGAQIALTSAAPLAISQGGTGAISTQAAISSLGIGMRMVEAQTTTNIVGIMNTGVSPNTFTVTATGVFATDGYTPVLGDIIAFALQTTTTQNGFWEVTTVGAVGVSAVFTRPSWYTGVVRNSMYMPRFGSTQNGFIQTFVHPTGTGNAEITVGTTNITMVRVNLRSSPASLSSNVFTGPQTLRANGSGAQNCPIIFQNGVALMGTPIGNAVEWFGDQMYLTTAAGVRTTNTTHVAIPATSTSAGLVGQVAVDNTNNWLYVCTATNVWKRVLLATF